MRWLWLTCALYALVFFGSDARTLTVGPTGDYQTIGEGINAAVSGDTVEVSRGTYVENIDFADKDIVLTSTAPLDPLTVAETMIDGNDAGPVVTFGGNETPDCVITGFTITNGNADSGGGIYMVKGDITNSIVWGNEGGQVHVLCT